MKYSPTWILVLTIFLGEVHTFWEKANPVYQNWILQRVVFMTVQWNIKCAIDQLNYILYFVAFFLYGKYHNKVNKSTAITFICFMILDAAMHFYNYKTFYYWVVYFLLAPIWSIVYYKLLIIEKHKRYE